MTTSKLRKSDTPQSFLLTEFNTQSPNKVSSEKTHFLPRLNFIIEILASQLRLDENRPNNSPPIMNIHTKQYQSIEYEQQKTLITFLKRNYGPMMLLLNFKNCKSLQAKDLRRYLSLIREIGPFIRDLRISIPNLEIKSSEFLKIISLINTSIGKKTERAEYYIQNLRNDTQSDFRQFFQSFKNLSPGVNHLRIDIDSSEQISKSMTLLLSKSLKLHGNNLKTLSLNVAGCINITRAGVNLISTIISEYCFSLECLTLNFSNCFTRDRFENRDFCLNFSKFTSLQEFNLNLENTYTFNDKETYHVY